MSNGQCFHFTQNGSLSLLQGVFSTQRSNPGLLHCWRILYKLNHKGSPRILKCVAYPFSRGSSWPRDWTSVSCIAGRLSAELPGKLYNFKRTGQLSASFHLRSAALELTFFQPGPWPRNLETQLPSRHCIYISTAFPSPRNPAPISNLDTPREHNVTA